MARMHASLLFLLIAGAMAEPRGSLTIDRIASIKHPSNPTWSPDSTAIAFAWDAAGHENLFVVTPGEEPKQLTDFARDPATLTSDITAFSWLSSDEILVLSAGKLHRVSTDGVVTRFTDLDDVAGFELSRANERLALVRRGQIWVGSLDDETFTQRTALEPPHRASAPVFSPDATRIAFLSARVERVADFLAYNGGKQSLYRNEVGARRVGLLSPFAGSTVWIATEDRPSRPQWIDNAHVLFERTSPDMKRREIVTADLDGRTTVLRVDEDERWWSPIRRDARTVVSPSGEHVAFISDESGFGQLYVRATTMDGAARQLTTGAREVGFGSWSPDSRRVAFYDNAESPMERFLRVVDITSGETESLGDSNGVNYWPRFSPDGKRLVFERTTPESSVDLYTTDAAAGSTVERLTRSMPPSIDPKDLTHPQPVSFPSRVDGKDVPGSLFVPAGLDRSERHPAIVWIHGSGSDQNFLGWHPFSYRMYYSANQYLAQQGYVILTVDYRGSSGYGRDWGTGHHLDLGGPDALDVASGADYLKTLPYIDPDRIGVWGLSYGGFLTLQVLTRTPTLFRCGINVAGVSDWATWGLESSGGWITGRMSTPASNPEGYRRTASIRHMETLERPLLVLHGTADVNVAFRESLNLVDVLLKQGKDFDFEVYPGELHFFRREHILRDAWRRAERFFDQNLKEGERLPSR